MTSVQRLRAIIEREEDGCVALCPELDIASEGASIEESRTTPIEALTLFSKRHHHRNRPAGSPRHPRALILKPAPLSSGPTFWIGMVIASEPGTPAENRQQAGRLDSARFFRGKGRPEEGRYSRLPT
jgi:hypothetical protein